MSELKYNGPEADAQDALEEFRRLKAEIKRLREILAEVKPKLEHLQSAGTCGVLISRIDKALKQE